MSEYTEISILIAISVAGGNVLTIVIFWASCALAKRIWPSPQDPAVLDAKEGRR